MSASEQQIAVERFGSGPAILLLHGGAGPELTWDNQMHLAQYWSLIVPTRRAGDNAETDADDVTRLLTKRTHLVGFGYGVLGVALAAQRSPELVRSLTLIETPPEVIREKTIDLDVLARAGIPVMVVSGGRDQDIETSSDAVAKRLRARREVISDEEEVVTRAPGFNDVLEDFLRGSAGTARFRTA